MNYFFLWAWVSMLSFIGIEIFNEVLDWVGAPSWLHIPPLVQFVVSPVLIGIGVIWLDLAMDENEQLREEECQAALENEQQAQQVRALQQRVERLRLQALSEPFDDPNFQREFIKRNAH